MGCFLTGVCIPFLIWILCHSPSSAIPPYHTSAILRIDAHRCIIAENNLAGIGNYGYIWQLFWKKLMLTAVGRF